MKKRDKFSVDVEEITGYSVEGLIAKIEELDTEKTFESLVQNKNPRITGKIKGKKI